MRYEALSCRARCGAAAGVTLFLLAGSAAGQDGVYESALGAGVVGFTYPDDSAALPACVDGGDFNGDGFHDLLLVDLNRSQGRAWVALGAPDGSYALSDMYEVNDDAMIIAAELDGDSGVEIVAREGFRGEIEISYDAGAAPQIEPVPNSEYFYSGFRTAFAGVVRAADLDGDGLSELVVNGEDVVIVRWSSRAAGERYEQIDIVGLGDENVLYEPGDYDGDGDLDLLLTSGDSSRFWLVEGAGTNSIGAAREIARDYPRVLENDRPVFGQLDDNPAMDLIIPDASTGTLRAEMNFVTAGASSLALDFGEFVIPQRIVGDLDGSGFPDMVVRLERSAGLLDYAAGLVLDPARPGQRLVERRALHTPSDARYGFDDFGPYPQMLVQSVDVDRDGDEDLLWFGYGFAARVSENRSGAVGAEALGAQTIATGIDPTHVLPVDLDGDGLDEAVVSGFSNLRVISLGDQMSQIAPDSDFAFMCVMLDIDGDGRDEVVESEREGVGLRFFDVPGDGTLARIKAADLERGVFGMDVADFNGDGVQDLLTSDAGGGFEVLLGGMGLPLPQWAAIDLGSGSLLRPAALDFNGDGLADAALGAADPAGIELHVNNGDGSFSMVRFIEDGSPYWITAADVNLDGVDDLVSASWDNLVSVHYLDGAGQVTHTDQVLALPSPVEVIVSDLDSDGLPDIAVSSNYFLGPVATVVTLQNAEGGFGPGFSLDGAGSQGLMASDVNGDGARDLLVVSSTTDTLATHLGTPALCPADLTGDGYVNFFDVSAFLQQQPDWNGDGSFNFFDVSAFLQDFAAGCP